MIDDIFDALLFYKIMEKMENGAGHGLKGH